MDFLTLWHQSLGSYFKGLRVTLEITGLALAVGAGLGALLAVCRLSRWKPLRFLGTLYVDVVRSVPVLVLLFLGYYGLGQEGVKLSPFLSATIALGGFYGSLFCETFRGGVNAVPQGQWEAAQALGMGPFLRLRKVILPQAFMAVLLPSTNNISYILKDSALVVLLPGIADLTFQANNAADNNYQFMTMYVLAGLFYLALYLIISQGLGRWETHVQRSRS